MTTENYLQMKTDLSKFNNLDDHVSLPISDSNGLSKETPVKIPIQNELLQESSNNTNEFKYTIEK